MERDLTGIQSSNIDFYLTKILKTYFSIFFGDLLIYNICLISLISTNIKSFKDSKILISIASKKYTEISISIKCNPWSWLSLCHAITPSVIIKLQVKTFPLPDNNQDLFQPNLYLSIYLPTYLPIYLSIHTSIIFLLCFRHKVVNRTLVPFTHFNQG